MSRIDAHYVSQVVTVMSSWQEVVQTAANHMEGIDTTIYLACHEDAWKASDDDDDDDDDGNYDAGSSFHRFDSSLSTSIHGDLSGTGKTGHPYTSTPLLHGGAFC